MLMTKTNRGFFQQSRGCNSKINDQTSPVFELIKDFIHVHLICKFQEDLIIIEQVMLMTNFQQSRNITQKINNPIWPVFGSVWDFIHVHSETSNQSWRSYGDDKHFPNCKSMWLCGCQSNRDFHWISMKSLCHQSSPPPPNPTTPPEACYRWEMIEISLQTVEI